MTVHPLTLTLSAVHALHLVLVWWINMLPLSLSVGCVCASVCLLIPVHVTGRNGPRWSQGRQRRARHDGQCSSSCRRAQFQEADKQTADTRKVLISGSRLIWIVCCALLPFFVVNSGGRSQRVRSLRDESALWWVFHALPALLIYNKVVPELNFRW